MRDNDIKKKKKVSGRGVKKGTQFSLTGKDKTNYFSDPKLHGTKYQDESSSRQIKYTRNFSRTMARDFLSDISDIDYLTILQNFILVDTQTGGNGETAFNNIIDVYVNRMYTRANDKDLVAANLTAFKAICCDTFQLLYEYMTQKCIRDIGNSLTENSATSGAINTPAYWAQDDWDYYVGRMQSFGPIPTFIYDLANACLFGCTVKVADSFNRWSEVIPPGYFLFWMPGENYADAVAIRDGLKANAIKAKTFMDKYGVPYEHSIDLSKCRFSERDIYDPDVRSMFCHAYVEYVYQTGAAVIQLSPDNGAGVVADFITNQTTAYTGRRFYFRGTTAESPIDALCVMLAPYSAVNNEYGILDHYSGIAGADKTTNLMLAAEDDLVFTQLNINTHNRTIWMRFLAQYSSYNTNAYFIGFVGDIGGVPHYSYPGAAGWPYNSEIKDLKFGTGLSYTEIRNNLFNYLMNARVPTKYQSKSAKPGAHSPEIESDVIED